MKSKLLFLLFGAFLLQGVNTAYGQKTPVFEGSFEDCKKKAVQENKMILIDLYFVGCMPCKEMDDKVFPDPAVVKVLQPDFLLYKTDVFKEEDGMKLARKYGASGFPTYIIVDPTGKAIMMESGFFGVNRFIPLLNHAKAMRKEGKFLNFDANLDKTYPAPYNSRFFKEAEKGTAADNVTFLKGKNLLDEVPFIVSTAVNTPEVNEWTYANLHNLIDNYGHTLLMSKTDRIANAKIQGLGDEQKLDSLYITLDYIRPAFNERLWSIFMPRFLTSYYKGSQNAESYLALIDKYKAYTAWGPRSNALGLIIINEKNNTPLLQKLRKEYLDVQKTEKLDFTDQYKLTLLHFYVKDYEQAKSEVESLLKFDFNNPFYKTKKSEIEALQAAIAKKDPTQYEAKNLERSIGFTMD